MWTRIEVLRRAAIGPGLFSDDPKKTFPFAESFDVLGTKLTVGELHGGPFTIENKPKRLEKISQLLNDLVKSGKITTLNFATSLVMGRSLKVASRAFASITAREGDVSASELGDPLCLDSKASRWAARPPDRSSRPEAGLAFTDAAYEADVATWGIDRIVLDPVSKLRTALAGQPWWTSGSKQVITQAEGFAAPCKGGLPPHL